jgi:hypothetical protein
MRLPCPCVFLSPITLLGKGSLNKFSRQRIHTQKYKNCWTRCFLCVPCSIKRSVCSGRKAGDSLLSITYCFLSCVPHFYFRLLVPFTKMMPASGATLHAYDRCSGESHRCSCMYVSAIQASPEGGHSPCAVEVMRCECVCDRAADIGLGTTTQRNRRARVSIHGASIAIQSNRINGSFVKRILHLCLSLSLFPVAPTLEHRASVKLFVSLQFLNPKIVDRTRWKVDQPIAWPLPIQTE